MGAEELHHRDADQARGEGQSQVRPGTSVVLLHSIIDGDLENN